MIYSREVLEMGAALARAKARQDVARRAAQRTTQLAHEGIVASARAEEAEAAAREAAVDVNEKTRLLAQAHADGRDGHYVLAAPIAGRVTTARIQTGAAVDGLSAPFVIDAADRYPVEAQVPAHLIGRISAGMRIELGSAVGQVTAVGSALDPATRSARLRGTMQAAPGVIAGKVVTVRILAPARAGVVSVPASALARLGGGRSSSSRRQPVSCRAMWRCRAVAAGAWL